jgi:EAL domain-containing protein (putative c-di-GMP-specific phosphodiesterase class I)
MNSKHDPYVYFQTGDVIIKQGDHCAHAFMIESGRVGIIVENKEGEHISLGTRGVGAIIGEMAIIDDTPRIATITALEPCKLLQITRDDFQHRLNHSDPMLKMVTQIILTRYREILLRSEVSQDFPQSFNAESQEGYCANDSDIVEILKLGHEFTAALNNHHLELHYQPVIDLRTQEIRGFEALMRWNHPERGYISPAVFIPIIEKNKTIVQASQWALAEACRALKRISNKTHTEHSLFMGVNFSATDFAEETFVDNVYNILSQTDIPAKQLHLEITESLLMQQPDNAKETLKLCRAAGMGIAIDDFGAGYTSLSSLHQFPINILKIDQSLTRAILADKQSLDIVRTIINLAQNLNLEIVVEGIEHAEEAAILKELGAHQGQGYFFSRPLPEDKITEFVKNWAKNKQEF